VTTRRLWIALALGVPSAAALLSARPAEPRPGVEPASVTDLVLTKRAEAIGLQRELAIRYTIVAANRGPDAATSVSVVDRLPLRARARRVVGAGGRCKVGRTVTCFIPRLKAGGRVLIVVETVFSVSGRHVNRATVTSTASRDPNPANNTAAIGSVVGFVASGRPVRDLPWFFYIVEPLTATAGDAVLVGYVSTRRANATARVFQAARIIDEVSSTVIEPGRGALRVSDGLPRGSFRVVLNARSGSLTRNASAKLTVRQ
jgi:hypothetical protein